MQVMPFPGCCTAGVLVGFGGSSTASYGRYDDPSTEEQMFAEIEKHLDECHRRGWAMVFAATTSQQEKANRVLPRIGFQKIDETAKANHREYPLLGWVFRLNPEKEVAPLVIPKNPFSKPRPVDVVPQAPVENPAARIFMDDVVGQPGRMPAPLPRGRVEVHFDTDPPLIQPQQVPDHGHGLSRIVTDWALRNGVRTRIVRLQGRQGLWVEIHPDDIGDGNPIDFREGDIIVEYLLVDVDQRAQTARASALAWIGLRGSQHAVRFYRVL